MDHPNRILIEKWASPIGYQSKNGPSQSDTNRKMGRPRQLLFLHGPPRQLLFLHGPASSSIFPSWTGLVNYFSFMGRPRQLLFLHEQFGKFGKNSGNFGNVHKNSENFRKIWENFRKFGEISDNFRVFPEIFEKLRNPPKTSQKLTESPKSSPNIQKTGKNSQKPYEIYLVPNIALNASYIAIAIKSTLFGHDRASYRSVSYHIKTGWSPSQNLQF